MMVVLLLPSVAWAQEDAEDERARNLFHQAVEAADQGSWDQAGNLFQAALDLRWAPAIAHNLAEVRVRQGRLVEAKNLLRDVLTHSEVTSDIREVAEPLLGRITARIAHITIVVDEDAVVRVDDDHLAPPVAAVPLEINPGSHTIEAYRGREIFARRELELSDGEEARVELQALSAEDAARAADLGNDTAEPTERKSRAGLWVGIIILVLALGGAATAVALTAPYGGGDELQGDLGTVRVMP